MSGVTQYARSKDGKSHVVIWVPLHELQKTKGADYWFRALKEHRLDRTQPVALYVGHRILEAERRSELPPPLPVLWQGLNVTLFFTTGEHIRLEGTRALRVESI